MKRTARIRSLSFDNVKTSSRTSKAIHSSQYMIYFSNVTKRQRKKREKQICTLKEEKETRERERVRFVFFFSILHFLDHGMMTAIFHVISMLDYSQPQQLRLLQRQQQKMNSDASMDMMDKLMDEMSAVDNTLMLQPSHHKDLSDRRENEQMNNKTDST